MKKLFLFSAALAILASCASQNEPEVIGKGEIETSYLSVNLVTGFPGTSSRAAEDKDFELGTVDENIVKSVRFYFFNADGTAAYVKNLQSTPVNYYDWTVTDADNNVGLAPDGDKGNNIGNVLNATVVIEVLKNDPEGKGDYGVPAYVMAIVNPTADIKDNTESMGKDALLEKIGNYTSYTNGNFVMSSAVYADQTVDPAKKVIEVSTANHIYPTREAAKGDPVVIYVERVLAKVRLAYSNQFTPATVGEGDDAVEAYDTGVTYTDDQGNTKKIYVRFISWDVTTTPKLSYLVKDINPAWGEIFGTDLSLPEPWNEPLRHRSYWAINPTLQETDYNYLSYNQLKTTTGEFFGNDNVRYPHENAAASADDDETTKPSQVIIGAQLVGEDGKALTFARYGFDDFLSLTDLKTQLLSLMVNKYYVADNNGTVEAGSTHYRQINIDDVDFVTESTLDDVEEATCYTRIQLKKNDDGTAANTYYTITTNSQGEKQATAVEASKIDNELFALGHQKIWESGKTYYYFDILHLGTLTDGETPRPGVVRNHVYNITLTKLVGLGTPVYDPDEEIIPQRPGEDDTFLAAQIKVLSWRIVNQEQELVW